jgi:phosphoenolpyruvate synthase/pyruvate phosphate dikinase
VTEGGLEATIQTCFASALDERVVAISLNPVSNCYNECVINANFGLGEMVVDGATATGQEVKIS